MIGTLKAKHDELAKSKLPADEVAKLLKAGAFLVDLQPKVGAKLRMARGATNFSVFTPKRRLHEVPRDRKIVLHCHSGAVAEKTRQFLNAQGFKAFNGGGHWHFLKIVGKWSTMEPLQPGRHLDFHCAAARMRSATLVGCPGDLRIRSTC